MGNPIPSHSPFEAGSTGFVESVPDVASSQDSVVFGNIVDAVLSDFCSVGFRQGVSAR